MWATVVKRCGLAAGFAMALMAETPAGEVKLTVKTEDAGATISRHLYGHFAEHLGRCVYDGLWVGKDSKIPNVRGFRKDLLEALKALEIPNLRWPGGCFADIYHWKDGVGPQAQRRPILNVHWGMTTEDNSFGTHEFLDLCKELNTEPYLAGNVGSGTPQEMQQWVEYCNSGAVGKDKLLTPGQTWGEMATLRATNGHPEPFGVKYWGVGNENWGCGGRMTPEYYADEYKRYANYVYEYNGVKPYKIACGASTDNYAWTRVMMEKVGPRLMDGLSLHYYTRLRDEKRRDGSATTFDEAAYHATLRNAARMDELVTSHSRIMDQFDKEKRVGLIVDEWGNWWAQEPGTPARYLYQQNTMRDAMTAGLTLNILQHHADRVRMANLAQTVNVLQAIALTEGDKLVLTPTYHVFDLYRVHKDTHLLTTTLQTPEYVVGGKKIDAVSVTASKGKDGEVNLTLCNLDAHEAMDVACGLDSMTAKSVAGRILTAGKFDALNTFENPHAVHVEKYDGASVSGDGVTLKLPPLSVVAVVVR